MTVTGEGHSNEESALVFGVTGLKVDGCQARGPSWAGLLWAQLNLLAGIRMRALFVSD